MTSSELSVDCKDSANPSFRKPTNEASRRNYRRHSPTVSHSPSPPSLGSGKRDRTPRPEDDTGGSGGGSKREKRTDSENDAGKFDNGRGRKESDVDYRSRSRHNRSDDYDHKYNRRHGYHDRGYYGSSGRDSSRHDDGRYSRRSPDRAARDRGDAENRHRRKVARGERDDKIDSRDRHGYRERDNNLVKDRDEGKERDCPKVDTQMRKERENKRDVIGKEYEKPTDRGNECLDPSRKRSAYHTDSKKDEDNLPNRHNDGTVRSKHRHNDSKGDVQDAASGSALIASDYLEDSRNSGSDVDDKLVKITKWGPESMVKNNASSPPDPEAARLAAIKAAQQVSINLGNFKSVDEKKKLLWRSKTQEPAAASGTIRWDTVQFADGERREKFKKLMSLSVLYISHTVGCQRRCSRQSNAEWKQCFRCLCNRKAARTATGSGKTVYCWFEETRWSNSRTGPIILFIMNFKDASGRLFLFANQGTDAVTCFGSGPHKWTALLYQKIALFASVL